MTGTEYANVGRMTFLNGCRILLVDDDLDTADLLRYVLVANGARVSVAHSADDALVALTSEDFDVLIADLAMPSVDGFELLRRARAMGHDQPAIAVSAHAQPEMRKVALAAGFADFLTKPLRPVDLVQAAGTGCAAASASP